MNKKVLLIEDDDVVRENIAELLELAGYIVKTAHNGKIGVAEAKKIIPDIIISDILMPELDGYGVLQIISKTPELKHIPFIFLTAKTNNNDFRKGMELGADDYIRKPFEESELLRAIETRLKRVESFENKIKFKLPNQQLHEQTIKNIKNFEQFLTHKDVFTYKSGETIYNEGNQTNYIYLIKKGLVKTFKINELGKELVTGYFSDKQYFGYSSFIRHIPHVESSIAITNTLLYKLSKDEINSIINNNHHIIFNFIDLLAENLIEAKEQLILQAYASVRKKTAITLLNILQNYPLIKENEITISRGDLASTIGIAKETLIRTLHDFKEEKLIDLSPQSIVILNMKKLYKVQ